MAARTCMYTHVQGNTHQAILKHKAQNSSHNLQYHHNSHERDVLKLRRRKIRCVKVTFYKKEMLLKYGPSEVSTLTHTHTHARTHARTHTHTLTHTSLTTIKTQDHIPMAPTTPTTDITTVITPETITNTAGEAYLDSVTNSKSSPMTSNHIPTAIRARPMSWRGGSEGREGGREGGRERGREGGRERE